MWYVSSVVVVFPLLPVIPIIFASVYLEANSISDKIDIPNFLAFKTEDELFGIPGLLTIYSASTKKLDS